MRRMSGHLVSQYLIPTGMLWLHPKSRYHDHHDLATAPCYSSAMSKWSSEIRLRACDHNNHTTHNHDYHF